IVPHALASRSGRAPSLLLAYLCFTLPPPPPLSTLFPYTTSSDLPAGLHPLASCRHPGSVARYADGWLLLPLCGIEAARRLHKDVRIQEICVPLVGQELREATHEHTQARLARRTAVPTSQAVRARGTLEFSSPCLASGHRRFRFLHSNFRSSASFRSPCPQIVAL